MHPGRPSPARNAPRRAGAPSQPPEKPSLPLPATICMHGMADCRRLTSGDDCSSGTTYIYGRPKHIWDIISVTQRAPIQETRGKKCAAAGATLDGTTAHSVSTTADALGGDASGALTVGWEGKALVTRYELTMLSAAHLSEGSGEGRASTVGKPPAAAESSSKVVSVMVKRTLMNDIDHAGDKVEEPLMLVRLMVGDLVCLRLFARIDSEGEFLGHPMRTAEEIMRRERAMAKNIEMAEARAKEKEEEEEKKRIVDDSFNKKKASTGDGSTSASAQRRSSARQSVGHGAAKPQFATRDDGKAMGEQQVAQVRRRSITMIEEETKKAKVNRAKEKQKEKELEQLVFTSEGGVRV